MDRLRVCQGNDPDHQRQRRQPAMEQIFAEPKAKAIILFAGMLMLIAIGVYVVKRLRGSGGDDQHNPADTLANFEEMHARGDLSDEEFRTIKTRLQGEMKAQFGPAEQRD